MPQERFAPQWDNEPAGIDIAADHRLADHQRGEVPVGPELAENGARRARRGHIDPDRVQRDETEAVADDAKDHADHGASVTFRRTGFKRKMPGQ